MDKFKEAGEKLKADTAQKESNAVAAKAAGASELAAIKADPILNDLYKENASVGGDNLSGQVPALKIYSAGRSDSLLANGEKPTDGAFYYVPTKDQFKELEVHILTISRGFRALGMPDSKGNRELKFNQLMGGIFVDNGEYRPFVMYVTGSKLSNMWNFGKEAAVYKSQSIPMFCLSVNLTTKEVKNDYGYSWVINFEIVKDADGGPALVHDREEFNFLKENTLMLEEMIKSIIAAKEGEQVNPVEEAESVEEATEGETMTEDDKTPF